MSTQPEAPPFAALRSLQVALNNARLGLPEAADYDFNCAFRGFPRAMRQIKDELCTLNSAIVKAHAPRIHQGLRKRTRKRRDHRRTTPADGRGRG